jgi:hypothetical protein
MSIKINMFLSNFSFFKNPSVEGGWGRGCVSSNFRRGIKEESVPN